MAESGDCSAGFSTTELPATRAGPIFQDAMISGIVPGHDGADDARGLAPDHGKVVRAGGGDLVIELVGELGIVLDAGGAVGDVDGQRIADDLADIERLEQRQRLEIVADQRRRNAA